MSVTTKKLNDGVNIHFIPIDRFKTVNMSINITRTLDKKEVTMNSLIPAVLRRGCELYPDTRSLNIYLEELYGASFSYGIKKRGNSQIISLNFQTIADKYADEFNPFEKLVDLSFNILLKPIINDNGFSYEHFSREKENLKQFIESVYNDKKEYAKKRLTEEMFRDELYGIFEYGSVQDLDIITPQSLYNHYKNILVTSPIDIFITGLADMDKVVNQISGFFNDYKSTACGYPTANSGTMPTKITRIDEHAPVTQGKLSMGFRTNVTRKDQQYYAMMVLNNLFGGSPHSKLFMNVREKLSLAYYAGSGYDSFKGFVIVNCGIEFDKYDITVKEVLAQLDEIKQGNFTDKEMEFSKLSIINNYKSTKDSGSTMEDFYVGQIISGVCDSLDDVIKKVEKVTKDEVVEAAKTIKADTVFFLKGE